MAKKQSEVRVQQDEEKPVPQNILAQAIVDISASMKKLTANGGLNYEAVVALVHDDTKIGKPAIRTVLHSIDTLAKRYCR